MERKNAKISGSGTISGGEYASVAISGSGKIQGGVVCDELRISGSGHADAAVTCGKISISGSATFDGAVDATESLSVSGSGRFQSTVKAGELRVSGSSHVEGDVDADKASISGSTHIKGALRVGEARVNGSIYVDKGVECARMTISGGFNIKGLMNVDSLAISLGGSCCAEDIGGETIVVQLGTIVRGGLLGRLFPHSVTRRLEARTIEATEISLDFTTADVVRGDDITIGEGSRIKRVEYSRRLTVREGAEIGEKVKV